MRCLSCQYDLSNLTPSGGGGEHRCPECGRAFDPYDSHTFEPTPKQSNPWIGIAIVIAISVVIYIGYSLWCVIRVKEGFRDIAGSY